MEPVTDEWLARRRFRFGDFVFVMDWDKVYGAGVNVHGFSKIFHTHRRTFYMPAGKAFAPSGRPAHNMIFEPAYRFKPQDEIGRIFFAGINMNFFSGGRYLVFQFLAGKFAVIWKLGNVKIKSFVRFVSKAFAFQNFYHLYEFRNMRCGVGENIRPDYVHIVYGRNEIIRINSG